MQVQADLWSWGTQTVTVPADDPPFPSLAVKDMAYTRPLLFPDHSARRRETAGPFITASGVLKYLLIYAR